MKKRIVRILVLMLMVLPCAMCFGACKDSEESPASSVASISVELSSDKGVDYVAHTNTLRFKYGAEISLDKDDFKVSANYDDETTTVVSDYTLDISSVENTPNVGIYEIQFIYGGKIALINVEIYCKKITKPIINSEQMLVFMEDTIAGEKIVQSPETTFDENTMNLVEGSVYSATDTGAYQFKIVPDANHVWETFETDEREEVVFDWKIEKATMYASEIETLYFDYEEGIERRITFDLSREQFIPFNEFFEVTGTISATEVSEYSFVVKLKEDKKLNYEFFEIFREEGVEFEYNADRTEITYFWEIA